MGSGFYDFPESFFQDIAYTYSFWASDIYTSCAYGAIRRHPPCSGQAAPKWLLGIRSRRGARRDAHLGSQLSTRMLVMMIDFGLVTKFG